ncbi:pentatricopeptide repeat-containing protein At1g09220, mitochondrial-like isoform X2 [Magnolia sinica]|uniref:pentatricopeptide repeat-containing protein At1g09220, mitochondrial-like isoform X2 n=1 Tax=Magnolia sinica TaxID=86752 RepID=UPI00265A5EBF|nr:pentatricopeptide repeat-containing protein At1g09220, mitochondrial-like isoform X2 [Magnolia sinica]XP_058075319.1 pentatricopeptide repeat-containing protein At1g09220, mitochondrial-like isoform X2 [Magnolia sinica]XP_058075320.1 pentatricopeptide repeat-containing protein At1g09220, mitochondrial-like isoform X2 [Magnolia sinica]XP_058075321.1 pentatricopeptide repeat-containing protein At1g09220, mitochondrial-like isoform X2 [Magnolia sinica]
MLWLRSCRFNLRTHTSSFHIFQWVSSSKQSTDTHVSQPNQVQLLSLLRRLQTRSQLMQIHCQLITSGIHHDQMDKTMMLIWNTLLREYSQGSFPEEALQLYKQMQDLSCTFVPTDSITFSFLIKACANLVDPIKGIQLHGHVIKAGFEFHVYVQTALVNMYSECQFLSEAKRVFSNMHQRNSVTWNVMITGLTKWGEVDLARSLFERMSHRTVISWTGIIDGYTRINRPTEALTLFSQMMAEGIKPTSITILSLLPAVSNLGALDIGESIHAYVEKSHCNTSDIRVSNSLIDMYGKCGSLQNAFGVFDVIAERRNVVSWTSMISALASHGMAREAINQFEEMKAADIKPNQVTFLSVLNACSHGGLVDVGMKFFTSMIEEYGILPGIKHYGCMIDMLGRAGMLDEAEKMVMDMPMKDNVIVWRTLLGACSFHGNVEMGERVMERILEMEKGYGGDYVLLSNIFARDGRFDEAERVRRSMDEKNVLKVPGISLVDGKSRI